MKDFEALGREHADTIAAAANSPEGKRLAQALDLTAVERAAQSGDTAALQKLLAQALSTPDGKALAQRVQSALQGK